MPVNIDVYEFKCFNQLRNGEDFTLNTSDFTKNLVGNIGEKVKIQYSVNLGQSAFTQDLEEWEIFTDPGIKEIRRSSGSFLDDNIEVGDIYEFYSDWENRKTDSDEYSGQVEFISSDGKTLKYSVVSGSDTTNGTAVQNVGLLFNQKLSQNENTALFIKFGLIGNGEPFNYLSKTTESQQVYYTGDMVSGNTYDSESLGRIKDWVTGSASVEFSLVQPDQGEALYIISQEFILNPFYILAFRQFINNGTIPELLEGDSSIKYAAELEFRKTLANTGSSKLKEFQNLNGFVGWFGENFNGLNSKYQIDSITYEEAISGDPLNGININVATKAIITISKIDASPITDYSCGAYIIKVPNTEDEYIGTTTNLIDNYLYKSETLTSPATSGVNISTSLVSGNLVIEYTVEYTASEKLRLSTDDEFLLFVQVEDPTISLAGNSDRVMLISEIENYVDIDYLADFAEVNQYGFIQHGQVLGTGGQITPEVSNEDGIILDCIFGVNTLRNVVINGISVQLVAYNSIENTSFELDTYNFNIGDPVFSGGAQQIDINTTRGYPLPIGDDFNIVKITTDSLVGDYQRYTLQLAQKITWQNWIFNPEVDNVFFDANEPNNNLNEKSSNYSGQQDYDIYMSLILNVTGEDDLGRTITGDYINFGGIITVNDYDESSDGVSGIIQTFDIETGNSLDGAILYNGKDTLFRSVFQNAEDMTYGIHRIEPSQNPGDGIIELSSIYLPPPENLLKPLDTETNLKFDLVGTELTTECIIDGGLIQEGIDYKLSARAGIVPPPPDPTSVVSESVAPFTIKLTWSSSAITHKILRSENGSPFTEIATTSLGQLTYFDFDAQYGGVGTEIDYTYQVIATIGAAESNAVSSNIVSLGDFTDYGFDRDGSGSYFRELALTNPVQLRATSMYVGSPANFDEAYRDVTGFESIDYYLEADPFFGNVRYDQYDNTLSLIGTNDVNDVSIFRQELLSNTEIAGFLHFSGATGDKDIQEAYHNTFNLDTANLDSLYNEIASLPVIPQNVTFNARSTQYTTATSGTARTTLINNGWIITDGGGI